MKKFFCLAALFILTAAVSKAHEYEIYNPETREKSNALMMSVAADKNSYYIGFYSYNIYCIAGKHIKTSIRKYKGGHCYPVDIKGNLLSSRKTARWKEYKPGTYDMERRQLQQEMSESGAKEVPFYYN